MPGVTAKSIRLEGTFTLSGPASGYVPIPAAMQAYFAYVNAKGGVNGREIVFTSNPIYNQTLGMKVYRQIMAKYDPKANANEPLNLYGVANARTVVQVLRLLGPNPTRAGLIKAARNMNFSAKNTTANPYTLPGVDIVTTGSDQYPISQVTRVQYRNNVFKPLRKLINGRGA